MSDEIRKNFLQKGIILLAGEINNESYDDFATDLFLLESQGFKEIEIRISSSGGGCREGLSIYDLIKNYPGDVTGVVFGVAYSMAAIILQACNHRKMYEHATLLVHDVRHSPVTYSEIDRKKDRKKRKKSIRRYQDACIKILLESSGMEEEELRKLFRKNKLLSKEQAIKKEFIDSDN